MHRSYPLSWKRPVQQLSSDSTCRCEMSHFEVPQFPLSFNLSFASDTLVIFSESLSF